MIAMTYLIDLAVLNATPKCDPYLHTTRTE